MLINAIPNPPSKEERLKFGFNIIDQEEDKLITFENLLKILQGNYFAGSMEEVEPKGMLLLKETANSKSKEDPISWDDYQLLMKKFQGLFFPTNTDEAANGRSGAASNFLNLFD